MLTYQSVIRSYSGTVRTGHSDTDLTPRQRRIVHVLLNLASNSAWTTGAYPPTVDDGRRVREALVRIVWDARPLVEATSPGASDDFGIALHRALDILTNL